MASLFLQRKLAGSFTHRNVTILSVGTRTRLEELIFRLDFDFGKQGTWRNALVIEANSINTQKMLKQMREYQDDILEQIGLLEDLCHWVNQLEDVNTLVDPIYRNVHPDKFMFQETLMQEKPMLFNAFVHKETLVLQIFAEGLYDLEMRCDLSGRGGVRAFIEKMNELTTAMKDHLLAIEGVQLQQAMGAEAA